MGKFCDKCGPVNDELLVVNFQGKAKVCEYCVLDMFYLLGEAQEIKHGITKDVTVNANLRTEIPSIDGIIRHMNKTIVGQIKAKETLAIAVRNHYKRMTLTEEKRNMVEKSNVLLLGPSGSGKSAMLKAIADFIDIPIVIVDSSVYTTSGYVGSDVEDIIEELYLKSGKDKEKTERGIVFLDEIDKKKKSSGSGGKLEPGGEQAQQSFLKLVEGKEVSVDKKVTIDTSNILFIAGGAFVGLTDIVQDRISSGFVGYAETHVSETVLLEQAYEVINTDDLIAFGMIPEFVGRFPIVTNTCSLTKTEMVRVIRGTDNSIIKQFQELLRISDGLELEVTVPAAEKIAERVLDEKIGVRGIRKIFEHILHDVQRNAESIKRSGGKKIQITKAVVMGDTPAIIQYGDGTQAAVA